jgi:hypothetical protein
MAAAPTPPAVVSSTTLPSAVPAPPSARPGRGSIPVAALARESANDYRRRARYPRSSQPIEHGQDPIARDRDVTRIRERGPNGEEPGLTVYPLLAGFESPEPAVLFAYLSVGETRVTAREMRCVVVTSELEAVGTIEYRDDGTFGDQQANDDVWTGLFVPGADVLARSYMVRVTAITRRGEERIAATSFLYSKPHAQLTGRYRDAVLDGSLVIEAEVDVVAAGRFHLEGTLYGGDGAQPIAWAQNAAELPEGLHWMPLSYYGLILHEKQIDGPYTLRYLALSTTSDMPNAKNRLVEWAYTTAAHRAAAFSDAPYDDPALLDAAERVERDIPRLDGLEAGGDS